MRNEEFCFSLKSFDLNERVYEKNIIDIIIDTRMFDEC